MTLKAYAVKNKMSLFNVVKLVKSGKVKSETVTEEGREKVYILVDENEVDTGKETETEAHRKKEEGLEERIARLEAKVKDLHREMEALKRVRL